MLRVAAVCGRRPLGASPRPGGLRVSPTLEDASSRFGSPDWACSPLSTWWVSVRPSSLALFPAGTLPSRPRLSLHTCLPSGGWPGSPALCLGSRFWPRRVSVQFSSCALSSVSADVSGLRVPFAWDLGFVGRYFFQCFPCSSLQKLQSHVWELSQRRYRGSSSSAAVLTSVVSVGLWVFRSFLLRGLLRFPPPDFPRRILQFSSLQVPFVPFFPIL